MLRHVDRIFLRVSHLESAVRYYRDVLGMKLLRQEKQLASFRLSGGETELVLHDDPDLPAEGIYYLVDDVRDLYQCRAALQLRFVDSPRQVSRGYRAAVKDPFGNVLMLLDRSTQQSSADVIEDAKAPGALFAGVEAHVPARKDLLIELYEQIGRTADDLPYTPHFEKLYTSYAAGDVQTKPSRQEVWRHLLNLRKGGKLPKLGEARSQPPQITPEAQQKLRQLLGKDMGKRDRLPYTPRFDELVDHFNKTQARPLSPHLVWRLVARMAK